MRSPALSRPLRLLLVFALFAFAWSHAAAQADGAQKWTFATMASAVQGNILSSPAVAPDGTVYIAVEVGSSTAVNPIGRLFAISPTGAQKWVYQTSDWIDSTPVIASDGTIYFGCWDGKLYALKADGSLKWSLSLGSYVSGSAALGSDGTIYIGTGAGNLCAVNPDGTLKWIFPTLFWIDSSPAVGPDGTIYVGSLDNTFYAVRADGTEKWHYTVGNDIVSSPAIAADGTVYFGSRDQKLYALTGSGTLKWSFETTDTIESSPVLAADGTVYFATTGGRLFALRQNGTEKWRYPAASQPALSSLYSTPAVRADGSIVFGTSDNFLYAVKSDGTQLWRSALGDWADSSPLVTPDGVIYIGCTDKKLYAFASSAAAQLTDWAQLLRTPQRNGWQPLGAAAATSGRLTNLSVRTFAGTDASTLIVGFSIAGSGSRNLLVRGVGPTLANFGVGGVLGDPRITFYSGQTATASNNNWEQNANAAQIASTATAVSAFPLPSGSLDAATLANFSTGSQTVQVSGANGTTGIALLELYDVSGTATARLSNVSARSFVGTGSGVLIAGFVVAEGSRAMLIRGIGPRLADFSVPDTVANPQLRIYNSQQILIAENDDWSIATNASAMSAAGDGVNAFPLTSGSKDSMMLVTLPTGSYTAQVSGVNSTTGVGLIEVYEIP